MHNNVLRIESRAEGENGIGGGQDPGGVKWVKREIKGITKKSRNFLP